MIIFYKKVNIWQRNMFGINGSEFLVILVVAILVVPARNWPDVARWIARAVKMVRKIILQINDKVDEIKEQVDAERPIDELVQKTTRDLTAAFSTPTGSGTRIRKRVTKK